ncbi:MAG: DNA polymerase III subunit gamma/tau [Planctomycetaceae bacterium]|nr:DNA polymerase III subunit gamma/tau [Planctomycetaceae bacterium]
MAERAKTMEATGRESSESYVVVARRYRPQTFEQLVGQNQVSRALGNAIETNRVGHAYLFTGARGVGKTSTARIFSKCLNCVTGPTLTPCGKCDACEAIASGEDVDVLEIDGASNRGIEEIRQLRSFVSVRPTRSKYKIYIIDEVHMLTKEAFNALLKTLEEPPPHVKFIFCTTNPEKMPITVLSRCQRFDFAPVVADEIKERLRYIVQAEGAQADDDALTLLARRAGGSMRDSQSLLEQLLAFSSGKITISSVHQMLGTAPGGRVESLVGAIADGQAGRALEEIHFAVAEGADVGQILEQLTGYFRDLLVLSVGSHTDVLLQLGPDQVSAGQNWAAGMGTARILASLQIFDWALARMRQSTQIRCLLEIAVVQASSLAAMSSLATAMETVGRVVASGGTGAASSARPSLAPSPTPRPSTGLQSPDSSEKKNELTLETRSASSRPSTQDNSSAGKVGSSAGQASEESRPETRPQAQPTSTEIDSVQPIRKANSPAKPDSLAAVSELVAENSRESLAATTAVAPGSVMSSPLQQYQAAFKSVDGMIRELATSCSQVEAMSNGHWRVVMENEYLAELCKRQDRKQQIEQAVESALGRRIRIDFTFRSDPNSHLANTKALPKAQAIRELQENPFVARLNEIFNTEWVEMLPPRPRKS